MKVFLDLDGVCADFFSEAVKMSDAPAANWRDMEYRDVKRVLEKIRNTPNFFRNLSPFPGTRTLVQSIVNIAGEFSVLSSPLSGYPNCDVEKVQWIEENFHISPTEIFITDHKPHYAPGNILIDDYGVNILEWEKAGGLGIKYQADEQHLSDVIIPLTALFKKPL